MAEAQKASTTVLRDGLHFGEGPRRGPDGRLFYSDFYAGEVHALDLTTGEDEVVVAFDGQPSGLGWLPDGRLLIVSMLDRTVRRLEGDDPENRALVLHADISDIATFHANDMLVDGEGRAYVGNFGFDLHGLIDDIGIQRLLEPDFDPQGAALALVQPDGSVSVVAEDLKFPNGMALLPDPTGESESGNILVAAETIAFRLTSFSVDRNGSLQNRRVWADVKEFGIAPDGIAGDGDGVWVAAALQPAAFRVTEGGKITHRVETTQTVFAVAVVDDHLVCLTAPDSNPRVVKPDRLGKIEIYKLN
ncbi:SMP-30/gluconolactonase/LRE family protein [Lentzea albidocapillata]|uniref:SMP-30/Gluconolaconase/LRE-like region-containing protein n=1 Tax=Lentzea albidocapillata TaxID=40571 RepID=A0A1W2EXN0_9PSEU|nr:SMP-30/gluconolactonase/LRE family protein [Lentzea albidocapillata]SMD14455.1 SMP-30/Gluconolaconase/LRE-like region-containing protein [Lentzea albidocapillata]